MPALHLDEAETHSMKRTPRFSLAGLLLLLALLTSLRGEAQEKVRAEVPHSPDARLIVERFAVSPDIVHPIGIDFDNKGRLLVIESHTHFRPGNYQGPKFDRVRLLEDTDGDGKADRFTTYFEGTTSTMDIAVHPDGSVYLATRNEILRLRDTDGDGKSDEQQRIVFLETKGNYPHNGLSGLTFDSKGNLYFGLGENLGASYKLLAADGSALSGEGEGGNLFWCTADGRKLRRVATGFWNPFGTCRDIFGRLFAVDNDPDAMPPCRLLHVVEGGDYGYQFRYGRSGRHPFQAWNGQLPGTLPMMAGTGEAPCEIISYESDGLPAEYLGDLLVASWADHRIERYVPKQQGSSFTSERRAFIQGGKDFRPVGIAVAPDGSLFISDWVLSDYNLHNRGAIWHVKLRDAGKRERPQEPRRAVASAHRPLREQAAKQLAATKDGRAFLREQLTKQEVRVRAAALTALIDSDDRQLDLRAVAEKEELPGLRSLAVRALVARGDDVSRFLEAKQPAEVRREAIGTLRDKAATPQLLKLSSDPDPFLRTTAVEQLARHPALLADVDLRTLTEPMQRVGLLLAHRASGRPEATRLLPEFLADAAEDVRFLAIKWIADDKLEKFRPQIVARLQDRNLNVRMFFAYSAALARLDNQDASEGRLADSFITRLGDEKSSPALRIMALQMVPPTHKKLTLELLTGLLEQKEPVLQVEAVRTLNEHPAAQRTKVLLDVSRNRSLPAALRAEAVVGLAERSSDLLDELLKLTQEEEPSLRDEALRTLIQAKLSPAQREQLEKLAERQPHSADLVARVLGKPFVKERPKSDDLDGWLARLQGPADPAAGRRVFFHAKLAACSRCHRVEGRGQDIGPDLSTIGQMERRRIVESIFQPNNSIAPHYQVWAIATQSGKTYTGMLLRTHLDEYTYVDPKGDLFKLKTPDIAESQPVPTSIMPTGLPDLLTDQELRDLLAYLTSRR